MLFVVALVACVPEVEGNAFVEPFDGATSVTVDTPLRVHLPALRLPEGQPVSPESLQVVDLDEGGFVEGERVVEGTTVLFEPTDGWRADTDYGWALIDAPDQARQPVLVLPEGLAGEALFSTRPGPRLLDAVLDGDDLCLVFSEEQPARILDLDIGGEDFFGTYWTPTFLAAIGDGEGATASCFPVPARFGEGDVVRWTSALGASDSTTIVEGALLEAWRARHRWSEP
ncbi:MAG: hypothetical protein H6735_25695 [Alphaproteobacteria bacterium]|nr:hypothetical protein [Alphaproteobacteria bacterium]